MQSHRLISLNFEPQSVTCDSDGNIFTLDQASGDVMRIAGGNNQEVETIVNTLGAPNAFTFDSDNHLFICDLAHQAILTLSEDDKVVEFVREYESKLFRGPNSIVMDQSGETQDAFFTDSGLFGEAMESGSSGNGSLYWIQNRELLQPIDMENLKMPYGVCLSQFTGCLYVAELQENRVLRYVRRRGKGGWIRSTWLQFSGRMGPSALAYYNGLIFVAHYDTRESKTPQGRIVIVDEQDCTTVDEIIIEDGCEISGLCVSKDGQRLYVSERVTKSLYEVDISGLPQ